MLKTTTRCGGLSSQPFCWLFYSKSHHSSCMDDELHISITVLCIESTQHTTTHNSISANKYVLLPVCAVKHTVCVLTISASATWKMNPKGDSMERMRQCVCVYPEAIGNRITVTPPVDPIFFMWLCGYFWVNGIYARFGLTKNVHWNVSTEKLKTSLGYINCIIEWV